MPGFQNMYYPGLLCCKTRVRQFIFTFLLPLQGKSEEEVSSAGEQLTSNRIYDGENTNESFLIREALFCFHCRLWLNKLIFDFLV
jgi:hypothetical protein